MKEKGTKYYCTLCGKAHAVCREFKELPRPKQDHRNKAQAIKAAQMAMEGFVES
jgi:hypothetical protein